MSNRIIIVTEHNLIKYPPLQSLLYALVELGQSICYIGHCSDNMTQQRFEKEGVQFLSLCHYDAPNICKRFINNRRYRLQLQKIFESLNITKNDLIIYDHTDTAYYIHDLLSPYRYLVLFYEFINSHRSWKYRMLYRKYSIEKLLHSSIGVIHCEYNRAQITKGLYKLDKLPYVLPNKPYIDESLLEYGIPEEVMAIITKFKKQTIGKRIVLYQGFFNSNERRLEEFCQACRLLPEEYVLVAMGGGDVYYDYLKEKYESEKIIFLPFITPPYHLLITQLASFGILSYFPMDNTYAGVINPLYCAPNKIFEYSKYSIPMISNDIPGLHYIFKEYHCGKVVTTPFTPEKIRQTILDIARDYPLYSKGALDYYNSIDIKAIISDIISDVENDRVLG